MGSHCLVGKTLSFCKMKRFGDGWSQWPLSITDVCNPLTCTLERVIMGNFTIYLSYHNEPHGYGEGPGCRLPV